MKENVSVNQPEQDDEIDLFGLVVDLWLGKWIIVAMTCISLAFGFSFNFYKKNNLPSPYYAVLAPFSINLYAPFDAQLCNNEIVCINDRVAIDLIKLANDGWRFNDAITTEWRAAGFDLGTFKLNCPMTYCLRLHTPLPKDLKFYEEQLQNYNVQLTKALQTEIKDELLKFSESSIIVQDKLGHVTQNLIELRRYLNMFEKEEMVINYGGVQINKVTPPHNQNFIIVFSLTLGGFLGCALVLLRSAISRRRDMAGQPSA